MEDNSLHQNEVVAIQHQKSLNGPTLLADNDGAECQDNNPLVEQQLPRNPYASNYAPRNKEENDDKSSSQQPAAPLHAGSTSVLNDGGKEPSHPLPGGQYSTQPDHVQSLPIQQQQQLLPSLNPNGFSVGTENNDHPPVVPPHGPISNDGGATPCYLLPNGGSSHNPVYHHVDQVSIQTTIGNDTPPPPQKSWFQKTFKPAGILSKICRKETIKPIKLAKKQSASLAAPQHAAPAPILTGGETTIHPPPNIRKLSPPSQPKTPTADEILNLQVEEMLKQMEKEDEEDGEKLLREQEEKIRLEHEQRLEEEKTVLRKKDRRIQERAKEIERNMDNFRAEHSRIQLELLEKFNEQMMTDERKFAEELLSMKSIQNKKKDEFDAKLQTEEERITEKNREHQKSIKEKEDELLRNHLQFEENLSKIRLELEEKQRESAKMWKEKMRRLKEQSEHLHRMLKYRIWNEIIERNWTNRLNVLRSSNNQVVKSFEIFNMAAMKLSKLAGSFESKETIEHQKRIIILRIDALLKDIHSEDHFLESETQNLQAMYEKTDKKFLKTLIGSIEIIRGDCKVLESHLKLYCEELRKDNDIKNYKEDSYQNILKAFDILNKHSRNVPTLAELKKQFNEEMHEQTETDPDYDRSEMEQTVLIEEIE